jgi:uncharacterized membrane protein
MTKELIVSGYPSQHTALLARAALSRQQDELSLFSQDIAVVSRADNGDVTMLESIKLVKKEPRNNSALNILAEVLFPAEDQNGAKRLAEQEQLDSIGIDSRSAARIAKIVPKGATAVLVIADENSRTRTSAILSAYQGSVTRVRLHCDRCETDLASTMQPFLE